MTDTTKEAGDKALKAAVGCTWMLLASVCIGMPLDGFALAKLWAWFVVPWAHAPALTLGRAIGLMLIAELVHVYGTPRKNEREVDVVQFTFRVVLRPAIALGLGDAVRWLMG